MVEEKNERGENTRIFSVVAVPPAILVPFFSFSFFPLPSLIPCPASFYNRKSDSSPCETTMDDRESKLRFRA